MSKALFWAGIALLLTLVAAGMAQARRIRPVEMIPTLTGQAEYCNTCHADLPEISRSHPVETFGCVICHGGERLALDADLAHSTMRGGRNPSNLVDAETSCGGSDCHTGSPGEHRDHVQRVQTSIQSTYAGAIANIRYTFGAQPDQTARMGISAVRAFSTTAGTGLLSLAAFDPSQENNPSILDFANRCLTCHLAAEAQPGLVYARLSGCAACHTPTAGSDLTQPLHRLTTAIPYTQCNTCHNRGNYDLRAMEFIPRSDQPSDRLHDYYQPIAQFVRCEWTLDCVDCHTRQEAMGDGNLYSNQKEIQYIQCRTCHGTLEELPRTHTITDPNDLALRMAFLNPVADLKVGDTILISERGEPLWNTRVLGDSTYELTGKATGQTLPFRPVKGSACLQKLDEQESRYCHACHAVERE